MTGSGLPKGPSLTRRGSVGAGASEVISKKDHHNTEKCPCSQSNAGSFKLVCTSCKQNWHADCLSLKGITRAAIMKLDQWLCPFCYVAPVPTFKDNNLSFCYKCRNTLTLQQSNSDYEVHSASEKLKDIQMLTKSLSTIDVSKMKDSIQTIQNLDLHLQHLLTSEDGLKDHQDRVKDIEKFLATMLSNNKETKVELQDEMGSVKESIKDLQAQIADLSNKQLQPGPPPEHFDSEKLLHSIIDQLDGRTQQEPDVSSQLRDIQQSLDRLQAGSPPANPPPNPPPSNFPNQKHMLSNKSFSHEESPVSDTAEDFIDSKEEEELIRFCESLQYSEENGHSVCSFGESYRYPGSKAESKHSDEIPDVLSSLLNKINEKFCPDGNPKVNSILINRYKDDGGYLPEHSDNEASIHPESHIITLSIGAECDVTFIDKDRSKVLPHKCKPRSVYSMSRRSQEHFRHSIEEGSITGGVRYSFTLRSVSPKNRASTCILADSNGAGLKFGDDHKRSFGKWLPGKNFWTPVIDEINPFVTCGYKNVVIMCGINDVRKPSVKSQRDIFNIFSLLEYKIEQIQVVNPTAQIFLCPLLPTKSVELNRKVLYFIDLIRKELLPKNFGVQMVEGFNDFLGENGLLSQLLSREFGRNGRPDFLHLNWRGVAKLGVIIRNNVLLRINGGVDKRRNRRDGRVDGRLFSDTVGGTAAASGHLEGYQPHG